MRVKSLHKDNYYNKQMRAIGDEYEMDDREEGNAKILQTLGRLEIIEYPKPNVGKGGTTYRAATMTSEPDPSEPPPTAPAEPMTTENTEALSTEPKRYRRRDMRAEK